MACGKPDAILAFITNFCNCKKLTMSLTCGILVAPLAALRVTFWSDRVIASCGELAESTRLDEILYWRKDLDKRTLLETVRQEIERTTGCTDPVAIALAVSRAARELGGVPQRVDVSVSPNIYKNAIGVGVPGAGRKGVEIAAALGAVIDHSEARLAILDYVTESKLAQALALLAQGQVSVQPGDAPDVLHVDARVSDGCETAYAIISGDYTHIVEAGRNARVTYQAPSQAHEVSNHWLQDGCLEKAWDLVARMTLEDLSFLVQAAQVNRAAAQTGLDDPQLKLARALSRWPSTIGSSAPFAAIHRAELLVGAASEARMLGLKVPVMALAGSGNQGITATLGVVGVAEQLGSSNVTNEQLAQALAMSALVTILIKRCAARMTAFCGSAIAGAAGIASGATLLLGGDFEQADCAMRSTIGKLACLVCDGAKVSCAYKVSLAAATAVQSAYLALEGVGIDAGTGILGHTIEGTFRNLGVLNNRGMVETDRVMMELIQSGQRLGQCHPPDRREGETDEVGAAVR